MQALEAIWRSCGPKWWARPRDQCLPLRWTQVCTWFWQVLVSTIAESLLCDETKKQMRKKILKKLANWLFAYLGDYGPAQQKRLFWSEASLWHCFFTIALCKISLLLPHSWIRSLILHCKLCLSLFTCSCLCSTEPGNDSQIQKLTAFLIMSPLLSQSLILGTWMENIVQIPFMKMPLILKEGWFCSSVWEKWRQQREFSAEGPRKDPFHMLQVTKHSSSSLSNLMSLGKNKLTMHCAAGLPPS